MARYINQLQNENKALKRQVTMLKRKILNDGIKRAVYGKRVNAEVEEHPAVKEVDRLLAENAHLTNTCNEHYKKIMYHQRENERLKRGNATLQSKLGAYQATVNGLCSLNVVNRRK